MTLKPHNTTQGFPTSFPFLLSIEPDTDLWLKPVPLGAPPGAHPHIANNQPTFYAPVSLGSFIRASVTISFVPEVLYDQAGLVLLFPSDSSKWIKGGLEYVDGQAKRSVVVTTGQGRSADWSVSPPVSGAVVEDGRVRTVVEFEREEAGTGVSLLVRIGGEVVREITWVFSSSANPQEDMMVGFYGARPAKKDAAGTFEVRIENWSIEKF
ncbi:hypothetical protein H0H93_012133 [Arthromyces matolae]|nr:hypothetical protein H0H93_012133 [Arthromyces matolae]